MLKKLVSELKLEAEVLVPERSMADENSDEIDAIAATCFVAATNN